MRQALGFLLFLACGAAAAAAPGVDVYTPGGPDDPRVRAAEYLAGNSRFLSAAALLEQVKAQLPRKRLSPEYYRDLAADELSFGMPLQAEAIYREQVDLAKDPISQGRARLRLADFYYQRGYWSQAATELATLHEQLPKELLRDFQDLQSRVMLAQGHYGEAAAVLQQVDSAGMTDYMRYNLGVAMVNEGRVGQGVSMLDRVGRLYPTDSDSLALRDKTNLTLGYHFLKDQQGGTAIPIFGRVRTIGPYSNKALLGLGWAYLAPRGSKQKKTEIGDEKAPDDAAFTSFATIGVLLRPGYIDSDNIYKRAGLAPFHLSGRAADEEAQLKQALVPWVELTSRDTIDPAVQEGLLAIPYVLDRLGAHAQAQQYYERAIAALDETRTRLDQAEEHVRNGSMLLTMVDNYDPGAETGWRWKLRSLPNESETFYLQTLIAENGFQEQLKNFRDARLLQRQLEFWKARLTELQQSYQTRSAQDHPPPALRADKSVAANYPPGPGAGQQLQMSNRMTAYSGQQAPAAGSGALKPVNLELAQSPAGDQFVGTFEKMQALSARIDALLPQLAAVEQTQRTLLQGVAVNGLEKQKALNQKYMVETRFALARVYDSELKAPEQGDAK
jgi:tetratricopeptide (TPR) repeat protein